MPEARTTLALENFALLALFNGTAFVCTFCRALKALVVVAGSMVVLASIALTVFHSVRAAMLINKIANFFTKNLRKKLRYVKR